MDQRTCFLCLCALLAVTPACRALNDLDFDNPCDEVDCDDGSICTLDRCTFDLSGDTTCRYEPTNEDAECGFDGIMAEGVTLVCRGGLCGAESLCDGVQCDDDDLCTDDACDWDGTCSFAPADCSDSNECTIDSCDSFTGECTHDAAREGGLCIFPEAIDDNSIPVGVCEEGVCVPPCDPQLEQPSICPPLGEGDTCCPGSKYCQYECS